MVFVAERVARLVPISAERMQDKLGPEDHIFILAFLKAYEQLEDTLHRTLKLLAMLMQLGKTERLSPRDVAHRAVSLGIFTDGRAWADAVRVRNTLAHEYPLNPAKQAEQVNSAWAAIPTLLETLEAVHKFVDQEGLANGDL